jgi:TonB family protein
MSYKSLLFCPDEKTARLVTQVLTELDFTVEVAGETYATVKKLSAERADALVVDCANEQDATLLFKAARDSKENHGSLAVALVEGQAGVAKAFRIGANLVLTKPINVEQSKGTLRVARGLLKKNQAKTVTTPEMTPTAPAVLAPTADNLIPSSQGATLSGATSLSPVTPVLSSQNAAPSASFSLMEREKESAPATEAADMAVVESLPHLPRSPVAQSMPAGLIGHVQPSAPCLAAHSTGGGAAAAPAVETKPVELHAAGAAPLVTNEPIIKEPDAPVVFEAPATTPTFSSLEAQGSRSGGGSLKIAAILLLAAVGGFFGWQKLKPMLRSTAMDSDSTDSPVTPQANQSQSAVPQPSPATPAPVENVFPPVTDSEPNTKDVPEEVAASGSNKSQHVSPDDVEVQEMPLSRDAKITVTPKPQPLVVKPGTSRLNQSSAPIAPPAVDMGTSNSSDTIAELVTSDAVLPKPAPGTIRISQGVSQGLLMKKVAPSYPRMALQVHKEGVVDLLATVSKEGRITKVKVLSGDAMLTGAAADAVRQWVYRPYLLNGQPVEVETQISVSFKLPR